MMIFSLEQLTEIGVFRFNMAFLSNTRVNVVGLVNHPSMISQMGC